MPVIFKINAESGYFIATWTGSITDAELLAAYKDFIGGEEWSSGLNELTDLSQASFDNITSSGLKALGEYAEKIYLENETFVKTAAYCPSDLPFGMTRIYQSLSEDSPENVKIFRERHEAESWLININAN